MRAEEWDACVRPDKFDTAPDGRLTDDCQKIHPVPDGTTVVLAFDGSLNNDWTVLSIITVEQVPHVDVVKTWDPPEIKPENWSVDTLDVMETIRLACKRWTVREIAADTARWKDQLETLAAEGYPAIAFPQTDMRMSPATKGLHDRVVTKGITHSGDVRLRQHMLNAIAKGKARPGEIDTSYRISKMTKDSPYKVDLAVTAVMGVDRALSFANSIGEGVWDMAEVIRNMQARESATQTNEQQADSSIILPESVQPVETQSAISLNDWWEKYGTEEV